MFSRKIIESDNFLDLNQNSQLLYFHLCMYADDDGFINNAKTVIRGIGAKVSDLEELKEYGYIHEFNNGIILIMHWKIHNYIQKDRYRPTSCVDEKNQVELVYNSVYVLK